MNAFSLLFLILLFGSTTFGITTSVPAQAQLSFTHGDRRIGTYTSSERGFDTSSYWIEGPTGLIFIDTQFLLSAGEEALNWAEQATGKKTELAIVLHPNPDKFNGSLNYKKRGIRVVTSEQIRALVPEVHKDRSHWFYERYKPDYPTEIPLPDSFGNSTQTLSAAGLTVKAHILGAGCSAAHLVVQFEDHVFVGDLVSNGNHSWVELGEIEEWLKRLDEITAMKPQYVHPGRGHVGGPELLLRQASYLQNVLRVVRTANPRGVASEKRLAKLQSKIESLYPGYDYTHFIEIGLPAVWEHEAKLNLKKQKLK